MISNTEYPYIQPDLDFVFNPVHSPQNVITIQEGNDNIPEYAKDETETDCGCGCSGGCGQETLSSEIYNTESNFLILDYVLLGSFVIIVIIALKSIVQ